MNKALFSLFLLFFASSCSLMQNDLSPRTEIANKKELLLDQDYLKKSLTKFCFSSEGGGRIKTTTNGTTPQENSEESHRFTYQSKLDNKLNRWEVEFIFALAKRESLFIEWSNPLDSTLDNTLLRQNFPHVEIGGTILQQWNNEEKKADKSRSPNKFRQKIPLLLEKLGSFFKCYLEILKNTTLCMRPKCSGHACFSYDYKNMESIEISSPIDNEYQLLIVGERPQENFYHKIFFIMQMIPKSEDTNPQGASTEIRIELQLRPEKCF
ncbi:MAG: hypothetical protein HQK53_05275 [Oligoflexia bacterium]|nr:hypothetical protein [Oligoflexia bacterium]